MARWYSNADLQAQLQVVTQERDRQYEFNAGQIVKHAEFERVVAQLQAQLQAVTQERNDAQNWLLDGVGGRAYLDSQLAQLQARNRKLVAIVRDYVGQHDGDDECDSCECPLCMKADVALADEEQP
jgi:ABC-type molybdenum transport system ATPase subunit/photorepair protein PhrA